MTNPQNPRNPRNPKALADELNALLATETRSLFQHLDEATPYLTPATYKIWHELKHMGHGLATHAQRLGALLDRLELPQAAASFRSVVANYHFIALQALLPLLIEEKQGQLVSYERAIEHAAGSADVVRELETLLADNRAQLETLRGYQQQLAATTNSAGGATAVK